MLAAECDAVRRAGFGSQETTLNRAALRLGGIVAGGGLTFAEARAALIGAGMAMPNQPGRAPWSPAAIAWKVERGLRDGARRPRRPADRGHRGRTLLRFRDDRTSADMSGDVARPPVVGEVTGDVAVQAEGATNA